MSAFITMWTEEQLSLADLGDRLSHTASSQFEKVGVEPEDDVYIVSTSGGRLLLVGRLAVEEVLTQAEAERRFGPDVYEASRHLIGAEADLHHDLVVPEETARQIERASGKLIGIASDRYHVNGGSLQSTGKITTESAALFDELLDGDVVVPDPEDLTLIPDGGRTDRMRRVLERNSLVRNRALRLHGCTCQVCGFDFEARYEEIGRGFAEVHHLAPLASSRGRITVDVAKDVAVLCANCHRMIHKRKPEPFTPDELRAQLRRI
jgi:hypothetical protein